MRACAAAPEPFDAEPPLAGVDELPGGEVEWAAGAFELGPGGKGSLGFEP